MSTLANAKRVMLVPPGTWEVDPTCSTVSFEVRHLKLMRVRGRFPVVTAVISCGDEGAGSITGSIRVASIDTGDQRRDARLCAVDFFDAEHHPTISFAGESQPVSTGDALTVSGSLRMRGVARPIELRAEPGGAYRGNAHAALRVRAEGTLSRREFGLDWDSAFAAGGLVIDDRVVLRLDVGLVRSDAANPRVGSLGWLRESSVHQDVRSACVPTSGARAWSACTIASTR